jgi:hypothetical protein
VTPHTGSGPQEVIEFLLVEGPGQRPVGTDSGQLLAVTGDDLRPVEVIIPPPFLDKR